MTHPLRLVVRGRPPALKNDRVAFKRGGKLVVAPNSKVRQYINQTKTDIRRQLPEAFKLIDTHVMCVVEFNLFFGSHFPRWDIDNMYTTLQECLIEEVIHDDNQVCAVFYGLSKSPSTAFDTVKLTVIPCELGNFFSYIALLKGLDGGGKNFELSDKFDELSPTVPLW